MNNLSRALLKLTMGLCIITALSVTALSRAEAFKLTVTNNYDKTKSFAILYYDDKAGKWLCRGWFNVPAGKSKDYNFTDSTKLKYAYLYSSVFNGEGEENPIHHTIISDKFRYYDGEACPQGPDRRKVAFSKFGMCINGAHLIWGEPAANNEPQQSNPTNTSNASITQKELQAIELLNKDREAQGLPRLVADPKLTMVARSHAADMIAKDYFSHTNKEGQSPFDRLKANNIEYTTAGENIAYNSSLEEMETAWMNSKGHRANILNTKYTHVGVGLAFKSDDVIYGVQLFASY